MTAAERYYSNIQNVLQDAFERQKNLLEDVARKMCVCVTSGNMLYIFGTGHAHMLAEELFYRAGGLAAVTPILDEKLMLHVSASGSTEVERQPGYARELLKQYPVDRGDILIICSNSGRNAVPVELAVLAKQRGALTIALTNVRHSQSCEPRNQMHRRLMEVVDIVLDNCGAVGDASIKMPDGRVCGATSTVAGAALLESLVCRCVELAQEEKKRIDVFSSSNVDTGDEINEAIVKAYQARVKCL